jgi:hypothetical protein
MTPKIEPSTKVTTSLAQSKHLNIAYKTKNTLKENFRGNVMHQSSNSKNTRSTLKQKHSL